MKRTTRNYAKIKKRDGNVCQYCGDFGDTVDHIVPQSWKINNLESNMVVSCMPCNSVASNLIFNSFEEKKAYILKRRKLPFRILPIKINFKKRAYVPYRERIIQ